MREMHCALNSNGILVWIEDLPKQLKYKCVCPACKGKLIPRSKLISEEESTMKIEWFEHSTFNGCTDGFNAGMRILAEQALNAGF